MSMIFQSDFIYLADFFYVKKAVLNSYSLPFPIVLVLKICKKPQHTEFEFE